MSGLVRSTGGLADPKTRDVKRRCGLQIRRRRDPWPWRARFTFQNPLVAVRVATFCRAEASPRRPGFNNNAILIEIEHIKSPVRSFFVIISWMQNHHLTGPSGPRTWGGVWDGC